MPITWCFKVCIHCRMSYDFNQYLLLFTLLSSSIKRSKIYLEEIHNCETEDNLLHSLLYQNKRL